MNKKVVFFGVAAATVLWYITSRQNLINQINISPTGIGTGGNILAPTITIDMLADNPSSSAATVHSINANILYNGVLVGTIYKNTPFKIAASSSTAFSIPINISDLSVLLSVYNTINNNLPIVFNIVGTAVVDAFTIPLNFNYTP